MSYFHVCPCGEVCDCRDKEEAAQGAANALDGKVEQSLTAVSASHDTTI